MPIRYVVLSAAVAVSTPLAGAAVQVAPSPVIVDQSGTGTGEDSATPAELRSAVGNSTARTFYETNGWKPVWNEAAAQALDEALAARKRHGLDRIEFLKIAPGGSAAGFEAARTEAALRLAGALASGVVDPASLHKVYTLPRPDIDLAAGLARALAQDGLQGWLEGLAPQDDEYRRLSEAYLRYGAESGPTNTIAAQSLIKPGDGNPDMPGIVAQLARDGYLDPAASADEFGKAVDVASRPDVYTPAAVEAVRQLQRDYGIAADGVIGPDTLAVLNFGALARARALAVALERRRWLSRTPPATRIDVNTAAARLRYFRDGKVADSRNVIVGRPGKETPPLMTPIYRLVANPDWTVPRSIQRGELANVGQDYLAAHNMVMRDGWIVQLPGPDNALGLVKLDMQNDQAIYLHDTSAPALFERSARHLSHGCVRVEDAQGFAALLAEDEGVGENWTEATLSGEPRFVPLPTRIPVRMLYHNIFLDDAGQLAFRTDPYGWNAPIAQALGFGDAPARAIAAENGDLGP